MTILGVLMTFLKIVLFFKWQFHFSPHKDFVRAVRVVRGKVAELFVRCTNIDFSYLSIVIRTLSLALVSFTDEPARNPFCIPPTL